MIETRRRRIFEKTDGHCAYCGKKLDFKDGWHIEHVIPNRKNGRSSLSNLVASCPQCNISKSSKTPKHLRSWVKDTIRRRLEQIDKLLEVWGPTMTELGPDRVAYIRDVVTWLDDTIKQQGNMHFAYYDVLLECRHAAREADRRSTQDAGR